jgi:hypothetical protein
MMGKVISGLRPNTYDLLEEATQARTGEEIKIDGQPHATR